MLKSLQIECLKCFYHYGIIFDRISPCTKETKKSKTFSQVYLKRSLCIILMLKLIIWSLRQNLHDFLNS